MITLWIDSYIIHTPEYLTGPWWVAPFKAAVMVSAVLELLAYGLLFVWGLSKLGIK